MEISFSNEYGESSHLLSDHFELALSAVVKGESLSCDSIDVIWVDDEELRDMHIEFLDDPTYTDVMTFNMGDTETVEAELYISVDRAIDHADKFEVTTENELCRLLIHGMLHLAGYDDHTEAEVKVMREKENYYLNKIFH